MGRAKIVIGDLDMVTAAKTVEEFKALGGYVLSSVYSLGSPLTSDLVH